MEIRLRPPVYKDSHTQQFQIIKTSSIDDTTTSYKDSSLSDPVGMKLPLPAVGSPTEEFLLPTEHLTVVDSPSRGGRTNTAEGHLLSGVTTTGNTQGDRLNTMAEEIIPVSMVGEDVVVRLISTSLFYILRINALSLILFALICLVISWDISYLYPIGFLWAIDFFELLQMLRHSRKYRYQQTSKLKKVMSCLGPIAKTFSSAGSKALLVLYLDSQPLPLVACIFPTAAYEILSSIITIFNPKLKSLRKMNTSILGIKVLLTWFGVSVALKFENILNWEWRETLLGYWMLFSIMAGFTIVSILCLINRCCVFFFADNDQFQVYGVLWAVLILAGKTTLSCMLVLNLKNVIVENSSLSTLLTLFFVIMCYNLGMLLFTLGYYTEIENFFKDLAAVETEVEQTQTLGMETKENNPKPQKIVVPKFLTKSSSTYYRRSTDVEIKEVRQKRKLRQDGKVKPKAKHGIKDNKKFARHSNMKSVEFAASVKDHGNNEHPNTKNTKHDILNTIAETDQDKATLATEMARNAKESKRRDKGKDFFSKFTNRTGVLGIVPTVAKRLGFPGKKKQGYEEQQDPEEGGKPTVGNQSYDMPNRANLSAIDFKDIESKPGSLRLRKTGRGQLEGKEIEELEAKLRMIQSMYIKPEGGQLNLSGELEPGPSNDNSMIEDPTKIKSGDTSMSQQCLICFDKAPDAVFMECGHGGICYECAVEIWKAAGECYLCRNKIIQVLQIDLKTKWEGNVIKVLSSTQMMNLEENNIF